MAYFILFIFPRSSLCSYTLSVFVYIYCFNLLHVSFCFFNVAMHIFLLLWKMLSHKLFKYCLSPDLNILQWKFCSACVGTSHLIVSSILNFLSLRYSFIYLYTSIFLYTYKYMYIYLFIFIHFIAFWGIFLKFIFWDNCFRDIMCSLVHLLHFYFTPLLDVFF